MDLILQDLDPRESYLKWFSNNNTTRPDGRGIFEMPKISFKSGKFSNLKHIKLLGIVSSAEGSVMVNYGETIVIAAIKSEVAEPDVDEPEKGFLSNAIFEINRMSYY